VIEKKDCAERGATRGDKHGEGAKEKGGARAFRIVPIRFVITKTSKGKKKNKNLQ